MNPGLTEDLLDAIEKGDLQKVKEAVQLGARINIRAGQPLMRAILYNHTEITEFLLKSGADPNNENGEILMGAAKSGNEKIVKLLLQHGADATKSKALYWATFYKHTTIVEMLLKEGKHEKILPNEALLAHAGLGNTKEVQELLNAGAHPKYEDSLAFQLACKNGHLEIAQLLLERGVDINSKDGTALLWACENSHPEITELLLKNGADPMAGLEGAMRAARNTKFTKGIALLAKKYPLENLRSQVKPLPDDHFAKSILRNEIALRQAIAYKKTSGEPEIEP